jgi:DNA end-binding protein Ku
VLLLQAAMPRAIWKGAISFGLVTIPVALYSATERAAEIHFRLLHAKDTSPIDYKRVCEAEGVEVPWSQIVRGYEYEKSRYVVLTDKDIAKARVEATQVFAIRDFVPARSIDFVYFNEPYYLAPTGRPAAKAYALLRDALRESGRVGIGTIVLRQREHLAALEPSGKGLALTTMRFAHEIRSPAALDLPAVGRSDKRGLTLARQLIDTLAAEWDPARYRDTYHDALKRMLEQKAKGQAISVPAAPKPARVVSLMDALQKSLKSPRREPDKAGRRRAPRRPVRRATKRVA